MHLTFPSLREIAAGPEDIVWTDATALTVENLRTAYRTGIFPWPGRPGDPIPWCSPDPRAVLVFNELTPGRTLEKTQRRGGHTFTIDRAFDAGATSFIAKPINWRLLNYQVRYVHRTCANEAWLLEERTRIGQDRARAEAALKTVAQQGSRFIAQALRETPALREAAGDFAAAVEAALAPSGVP